MKDIYFHSNFHRILDSTPFDASTVSSSHLKEAVSEPLFEKEARKGVFDTFSTLLYKKMSRHDGETRASKGLWRTKSPERLLSATSMDKKVRWRAQLMSARALMASL